MSSNKNTTSDATQLGLPAAGQTTVKVLKDGNILLSNGDVVDKFGNILYNAKEMIG